MVPREVVLLADYIYPAVCSSRSLWYSQPEEINTMPYMYNVDDSASTPCSHAHVLDTTGNGIQHQHTHTHKTIKMMKYPTWPIALAERYTIL